jgi:SAM-dependent methyltransferase
MSFDVSGDAYDLFMGRYSQELAPVFADFAGIEPGLTALDVGCGSGVLTEELARRLDPEHVAAVDPSPLVEACAARVPGADVRGGAAEELPFPEASFDAALAQLVIHFLDDPVVGVGEMRRVVRPGGLVAACSWDFPAMQLLRTFWDSVRHLDPAAPSETLPYATLDGLGKLGDAAGLEDVDTAALEVSSEYENFDELWDSFLLGVGPAGQYCVSLDPEKQAAVRDEYRRRIGDPSGSFALTATAWAVRGRRPAGA